MKTAKRMLVATLATLVTASMVLAIIYPEQFVLLLVGVMLGFIVGVVFSGFMEDAKFNKGLDASQELTKKALAHSNPASMVREMRLSTKEQPQSQQAIPRFDNITGLN